MRAAFATSRAAAGALALALMACGGEVEVGPRHGKMSGYYRVSIALPGVAPAAVTEVRLGGVAAYDLTPVDERHLEVTVQGAPSPGLPRLELSAPERHTYFGKYTYDSPVDPRFARLVAIGASLSQGVQNGVPSFHGALMSPPAQLARQLGGYFPLPLLTRDLLPDIAPKDFGPPPDCRAPDIVAFVTKHAAGAFLKVLQDGYDTGRANPEVDSHNLAIGGSHIHEVVYGPGANVAGSLIAHLVYQPYDRGEVKPQLVVAESLAPTLVMIADLYYNDIGDAILKSDVVDPSLITPEESVRADLGVLLDRLQATGAEVFIANMPRPSLLPAMTQKRAAMIAKGSSVAAADAAVAAVDARAASFNALLRSAANQHARVHVVDAAAAVATIGRDGLMVGGEALGIRKFGGILGLDGVHFTNTGYAVFANLFIAAINDALATSVPAIDLTVVHATDPGSPAAIAAAGLDVTKCTAN